MTTPPLTLLLAAALALPATGQAARYTYHGNLLDGDAPARGAYDLRIRSFGDPGDLRALGGATELPKVMLVDGAFSVDLDVPEDPDGTTWVEVAVRAAGSGDDFEKLGDPQPIAKANSTCPGAWALDGNTGVPAGSFLGIADPASAAQLELRAGNQRVAAFEPAGTPAVYGSAPNVVLGSPANVSTGRGSTVSGGGATLTVIGGPCSDCGNTADGDFATVSGGRGNQALGQASTVAGGAYNEAGAYSTTVSGGVDNTITSDGTHSAVGGGTNNMIDASYSVIDGGSANTVDSSFSAIAGGNQNRVSGSFSAIGGGQSNHILGQSSYAVIAGGIGNVVASRGTVPGGQGNLAGRNSLAAGNGAHVRLPGDPPATLPNGLTAQDYAGAASLEGDEGSFVWADSAAGVFRTSGPRQFLVRASGGIGVNTATFGNAPDLRLSEMVIRNPDAGGNVDFTLINQTHRGYGLAVVPGAAGAAGEFYISETDARTSSVAFVNRLRIDAAGTTFVQGGAVGMLSDARLKKNFAPIDQPLDTLLALRGQVFEYIDPAKSMSAPGPRMGFVAQEVQRVLPGWVKPTGKDGYLAVTPVGFEALVVEAMRDLKAESDVRVERVEEENRALQARLSQALDRIERLEQRAGH